VERATARAVCLALAEALARFGVPEEIITDNGKQFTDRFGKYRPRTGEVLFDKICRKNGITHRLTAPASPNQNGSRSMIVSSPVAVPAATSPSRASTSMIGALLVPTSSTDAVNFSP